MIVPGNAQLSNTFTGTDVVEVDLPLDRPYIFVKSTACEYGPVRDASRRDISVYILGATVTVIRYTCTIRNTCIRRSAVVPTHVPTAYVPFDC